MNRLHLFLCKIRYTTRLRNFSPIMIITNIKQRVLKESYWTVYNICFHISRNIPYLFFRLKFMKPWMSLHHCSLWIILSKYPGINRGCSHSVSVAGKPNDSLVKPEWYYVHHFHLKFQLCPLEWEKYLQFCN